MLLLGLNVIYLNQILSLQQLQKHLMWRDGKGMGTNMEEGEDFISGLN